MAQDKTIGNKAYIKVIKTLQLLFAESYRNGGWLPGGREMAKKLEISHSTYCKALACLEDEGFVKSYPCKGHYVTPDHLRCHKIGIILRDGSESPFVEECDSFMEGIKALNRKGFDVQFIQSTRPEQLHDNAIAHGVDGILWFKPSRTAVPYTGEISKSGDIPLVVVCWGDDVGLDFGACRVRKDNLAHAQVAAMLERGHTNVVVFGYAEKAWTIDVMKDLAEAGVKAELYEADNIDASKGFRQLLEKSQCTGVISCGGSLSLGVVANAVVNIPERKRPEILAADAEPSKLTSLLTKNVEFMMLEEECSLGEAAANLLTDHILHGMPLADVNVGFSRSGIKFYSQKKFK